MVFSFFLLPFSFAIDPPLPYPFEIAPWALLSSPPTPRKDFFSIHPLLVFIFPPPDPVRAVLISNTISFFSFPLPFSRSRSGTVHIHSPSFLSAFNFPIKTFLFILKLSILTDTFSSVHGLSIHEKNSRSSFAE